MEKRVGAPGMHPTTRKKPSEYLIQLREKQKVKRAYGLLEKQFHGYYEEAERMKGKTGETMLSLLERRLDNVCYRLGLGASRAQARQIVNHTHILVNGKKVNIPSYQVSVGDVISVKETSAKSELFAAVKGARVIVPKWLEFDPATLTGKVTALPAREDIDLTIAEHLIIELYSK
jgi:small subunit ribosomal protein S4